MATTHTTAPAAAIPDGPDFDDPAVVERIERFAATPEANRYAWAVGFDEATALARALGLVN